MSDVHDPFEARTTIETPLGQRVVYRLDALKHLGDIGSLPYTIKVLLESVLRNHDGHVVTDDDVQALAQYDASKVEETEIAFTPGRVVLQDFTGVPAVVDLAAMRSAIVRMTGDEVAAQKVNPLVPSDLVIDHSVQVDAFNSGMALQINSEREFERNRERYEFLKWGQSAFSNFRVVPPATGIVHQVNLEYLAKVAWDDGTTLYPDSLVGTDSHTTMINGLGVVGWGVGGIEAEAVMLGQPVYMLTPEVVGFKLSGRLPEGATATDLVLTVTQMLRQRGVVGKFVEFYGDGIPTMNVADRATIANMAPEYGATCGFFPVDEQTLRYLRQTGRPEALIQRVEQYCRHNGLFYDPATPDPVFSDTMELDMASVEPSLAGPKRPQDRIVLGDMKQTYRETLLSPVGPRGLGLQEADLARRAVVRNGADMEMKHGDVVIAAITSCTNTSNPSVMIGAGLLAKKAVEKGLSVKPYVKTSLAPGSKVVTDYLEESGLMGYLEKLGFHVVGYGCTTCIGNSGPLPEAVASAIQEGDLVVSSVLSGNRNFEGRVHPLTRTNYLASPPLVVAYALAGTTDIDLTTEPLGLDQDGEPVYLRDIWPAGDEIQSVITASVKPEFFLTQYGQVTSANETWNAIPESGSELYPWDPDSTYIQEPPFFVDLTPEAPAIGNIAGARVLVRAGDSTTTDHISPAGAISRDGPAADYLRQRGVEPRDFNSFGSRRGNDRVMTRGTFANVRFRNQMAPGTEGGWTTYLPTGEVMTIYDASLRYKASGTPLVVLAGKDYGMGSSRDWAAKGTLLLGIRLVIAESYERIHRSNLVGMGVLPLQFQPGESPASLGLDGTEIYSTLNLGDDLAPRQSIAVRAVKADGSEVNFATICRIDTPVEVEYYRNGGILHTVLRNFLRQG